MEAISGAASIPAGGGWPQVYGTAGTGPLSAQSASAGSVAASQSVLSLASTSMTASVASFAAAGGAAASNNELLGAVLLLLILEYLKSEDAGEKRDLMSLIGTLLQQQQQAGAGSGMLMYSSSSLSIESTQLQVLSSEVGISAYSGAAATCQQAPGVDPGAAGLNVIA